MCATPTPAPAPAGILGPNPAAAPPVADAGGATGAALRGREGAACGCCDRGLGAMGRMGRSPTPRRYSELRAGVFLQATQLHFSEQATPLLKHSQYFFRQADFRHLHPVLCTTASCFYGT